MPGFSIPDTQSMQLKWLGRAWNRVHGALMIQRQCTPAGCCCAPQLIATQLLT